MFHKRSNWVSTKSISKVIKFSQNELKCFKWGPKRWTINMYLFIMYKIWNYWSKTKITNWAAISNDCDVHFEKAGLFFYRLYVHKGFRWLKQPLWSKLTSICVFSIITRPVQDKSKIPSDTEHRTAKVTEPLRNAFCSSFCLLFCCKRWELVVEI